MIGAADRFVKMLSDMLPEESPENAGVEEEAEAPDAEKSSPAS